MSKEPPADPLLCPSCGGTVSVIAPSDATEWTTCPHCQYEWACPPAHEPKTTPKKPEPRRVRFQRRIRLSLFTVGLVLSTTGVALCFEPDRFPAGGGVSVNPVPWIVFAVAVACYSASRPWRWAGFSALLLAAGRYGTGNTGEWLIVCVGTLCGLLLREPTEKSTVSDPSDPLDKVERKAGDPVAERRHGRERRRMRRRRRLLLLSTCVLIYVPLSLAGSYLFGEWKDGLIRERREALVRKTEWEENRLPDTPEHLIVLHRAPHDGFRTYADFAKELEESPLHNYDNRSFRFVGKISGGKRFNQFDPHVEIKIRDRDGEGTYDTVYFRIHARRTPTPIERNFVIGFDDADSGLVVIDGIFENRITFGHCAIRWHGKGDDWDAALKEAKKGLDMGKVNQGWKPVK